MSGLDGQSALYLRQSDPDCRNLGKDSLSIDTQHQRCLEVARRLDLGAVVFSEQITAEVFDERPQLRAMLGRLDDFKAVICYKYDRLARDPDQMAALVRTMQAKGVRVISATEPEIQPDPVGRMLAYIMGTMAAMEKAKIQERARDTKSRLQDLGHLVCNGVARYGYRYDDRKRVVVPEHAEVVRRIFGDLIAGQSLRRIATSLTAEGVPSPRGGKWNEKTLSNIVHDPCYHGEPFRAGKERITDSRWRGGRRKRVKAPPEDHRAVGEATPAVIDRDTWEAAQKVVGDRTKNDNRTTLKLWLRGHLYCYNCGHRMSAFPRHTGTYEYRCHTEAHGLAECRNTYFPVEAVEGAVWEALAHHLASPEVIRGLIEERLPTEVDWETRVRDHEAAVETLKRQMGRLVARFSGIDDDVIREAVDQQIRSLAGDIRREESILREVEGLARTVRGRRQIVESGMAQIEEGRRLLTDPTYDQRCRLLDLLGLRVDCAWAKPPAVGGGRPLLDVLGDECFGDHPYRLQDVVVLPGPKRGGLRLLWVKLFGQPGGAGIPEVTLSGP